MLKQVVEVVAALIWDKEKFLICQRPANKARGLLWEFNCTVSRGQPQLLEHNAMAWITPLEIPRYEFCPADVEILKLIENRR